MNLCERTHPIIAIAPTANGSAADGDIISMKNTNHVTVVVTLKQGHATPPKLTLHQAKDIAGLDEKALEKPVNIFFVKDAEGSDIVLRQDPAVEFTLDAELKQKVVLFEVPVDALDMNEGFSCFRLKIGASNAANLVSAMYWCSGEKYHGATKIAG